MFIIPALKALQFYVHINWLKLYLLKLYWLVHVEIAWSNQNNFSILVMQGCTLRKKNTLTRLPPNGCLQGTRGALQFTLGRPKFQTGCPNRAPKTYDSQANFQWTNNKIPCSFCTLKWQRKTFAWSSAICKKVFLLIEGKHTAACREIHLCEFHCRAVEVSRLKMALNEFNSLWKTFDNKIMTSFSIRNVRSLLHEVKTDKKLWSRPTCRYKDSDIF